MSALLTPEVLLEVRNLRIDFRIDRDSSACAVDDISFVVPRNQTVALVGESGSGKSVTALSILGLLADNAVIAPTSQILFEGRELLRQPRSALQRVRGSDISMIFQEPMTSLNPVFTVGEQIVETLELHTSLNRAQAAERAVALLAEVGISEPALRFHSHPHELSGGQQQRVMIAMAIACEPKLLIADEPTTALDVTVGRQIIDVIARLQQRRQMSVLFITHDLGIVAEIADRVVVMRKGQIREQGPADVVLNSPHDLYTRALLACRPPLDRRPARLPVIEDFLGGAPPATPQERHRGIQPGDQLILEVQNLGKIYYRRQGLFGRRAMPAVREVSFQLYKGRTLGVVGESGSGKTTLGLSLLRLIKDATGSALFDGQDLLQLSEREFLPFRRRIQIVFQNPYASLNPRFTVERLLLEPLRVHRIGSDEAERRRLAHALLERVGLPLSAAGKYPHEFSGGQRQRIAIARCLTLQPEILICDEAVSALDVSVQAQVLNLLQELQDELSLSYIFISHDLAVVRYMSDEVLVMKDGQVVEMAPADQLYSAPQHEYTRELLTAESGRRRQTPG